MKKICKQFRDLLFACACVFCAPLYAKITVVSPSGAYGSVWANRQILLVNTTDGEEVFYSFSGSDPLESGFVYDGPVLLDVAGTVELNVTGIDRNRERHDYVIKYTVDESKDAALSDHENAFIQKMKGEVTTDLICGDTVFVPPSFEYSISSDGKYSPFEPGRGISISKNSNIERFFSLAVKSKDETLWNFIVHTVPAVQGEFTKIPLPFEFDEWSNVRFSDSNYIYAVDGGLWQGSGKTVELDRTVPHVIKWQNVHYDEANPVHSYTVPPAPQISSEIQEDSTVVLSLEGDASYRFSPSDKNQTASLPAGLYKTIVADAFPGENFSAAIPVDVYSENVFHGSLLACVKVNRRKPLMPDVMLNSKTEVSRDDVEFFITSDNDDAKIKYFVFGPHKLDYSELNGGHTLAVKIDESYFKEYGGEKMKLAAEEGEPVLYKVFCYAVDRWDNVSDMRCADIVIDKCDYFVDGNSKSSNPDGTYENPFSDFSQIETVVNANRFSRFYVSGKVEFPDAKISLKQNSQIVGIDDAEIVFPQDASLYVINSSLHIENVRLSSVFPSSDSKTSFFNVENSVLTVENSEISFGRSKNATLFNCLNSVLNIKSAGVTSFANDYACAVSAGNSKIFISQSRVATIGNTNVNFSCKNSKLNLSDSTCTVSGFNCRIAELFSSDAEMTGGTFEAKEIQSRTKNIPVWKDGASSFSGTKNLFRGF